MVAGKEYFYTFLLVQPNVNQTQRPVFDSLRFSVRIPTDLEMARIDNMIERIENPLDPKAEKLNKVFDELKQFVEFDGSLTAWEKAFVKEIEESKLTEDEKRSKIGRLKAVIAALRLSLTPIPEI